MCITNRLHLNNQTHLHWHTILKSSSVKHPLQLLKDLSRQVALVQLGLVTACRLLLHSLLLLFLTNSAASCVCFQGPYSVASRCFTWVNTCSLVADVFMQQACCA
jgi:hypothetical protein